MNEIRPTVAPSHGSASGLAPSHWVMRHLPALPADAPAQRLLDIACGGGRHTRLALDRGYAVTAIDRDTSGVADLAADLGLRIITADLEAPLPGTSTAPWPLPGETFDVVVVTNYLWRPLFPAILDAVGPNGTLIYETFAVGQERLGRPSNPDFLLRPGELIAVIAGRLTPIAFEHVRLGDPKLGQDRIVQRLVAVGPQHAILVDPLKMPLTTTPATMELPR